MGLQGVGINAGVTLIWFFCLKNSLLICLCCGLGMNDLVLHEDGLSVCAEQGILILLNLQPLK